MILPGCQAELQSCLKAQLRDRPIPPVHGVAAPSKGGQGPWAKLQRHTLKTQGTNTTFFSNAAEHVLQIHTAVSQCENSPWISPKQLQQPQTGNETQGGTVLCPAHLIAHLCFSLAQFLKKELLELY